MIVAQIIRKIAIAIISGTSSILSQLFTASEVKNDVDSIQLEFSGKVVVNDYGKSYVATRDIKPGTIVEQFVGPSMKFEDIPEDEICYAACIGNGLWMIPMTNARYMNHSCEPNCEISKNGDVIAQRFIKAGEEITFDYVTISKERYLQAPKEYFWDPRWSFDCKCGSPKCHKRIDRYIIEE